MCRYASAMFNAIITVLWPIISSKPFKLFLIDLMERYVKTTDNDIDDTIAATIRKALLPNRV